MKKSRIVKLIAGTLVVAAALTGCSAKANQSTAAKTESKQEAKKVIVGTGNAFKPYCYLDDKGNPVGFEIEVLKEINKRLPQYKFEFETMEFKNLLISLESGKIDIATHQFAKNPEREQKYLFANESYTAAATKLTVLKSRNDIKSLEDLYGKNVQVSPGSNDAYLIEKYNNEHGNKIKLVYGALDTATLISTLESGKIDATTSITRTVDTINKTYGDKIKTVGDTLYNSYTYQIFRKDETQLRDDVDKALQEMKKDGTLSKLSVDILGADYTK